MINMYNTAICNFCSFTAHLLHKLCSRLNSPILHISCSFSPNHIKIFQMEDLAEDHVSIYDQIKKDKRPFLEMEVTSLVEGANPVFT